MGAECIEERAEQNPPDPGSGYGGTAWLAECSVEGAARCAGR